MTPLAVMPWIAVILGLLIVALGVRDVGWSRDWFDIVRGCVLIPMGAFLAIGCTGLIVGGYGLV